MFKRNADVGGPGRMKVKELRPESKVDVIELTIRQKGDARDFSSRSGSTGKVADAKAVDDEGTDYFFVLDRRSCSCFTISGSASL